MDIATATQSLRTKVGDDCGLGAVLNRQSVAQLRCAVQRRIAALICRFDIRAAIHQRNALTRFLQVLHQAAGLGDRGEAQPLRQRLQRERLPGVREQVEGERHQGSSRAQRAAGDDVAVDDVPQELAQQDGSLARPGPQGSSSSSRTAAAGTSMSPRDSPPMRREKSCATACPRTPCLT